jgi:hypothetical protein
MGEGGRIVRLYFCTSDFTLNSTIHSSLSIALQSANSQAIIGGRQLNLHRAAVDGVS